MTPSHPTSVLLHATVPAPSARLTEESAEAFADAVFRRVCAGTASFAELLAAVTLAESMRDRGVAS